MGKRLTNEEREEIVAALNKNPNALEIGRQTGHSHMTVLKIAKAEGIVLISPEYNLIRAIFGVSSIRLAATYLDIKNGYLHHFLRNPEIFSNEWRQKFFDKLLHDFPDKKAEIALLESMLPDKPASASNIKKPDKKAVQKDFREAAGLLLQEMREECGLTIETVKKQTKHPLVKRNLERIEAGDTKLAFSIYREAIKELCCLYVVRDPVRQKAYKLQLDKISEQLRR